MTYSAASRVAAEDDENTGIKALLGLGAILGMVGGTIIALFALLIAASLADAWVFVRVWRWFAMPLGAPALGYWASFGLLLLVRFARPQEAHVEREGEGKVKTPLWNFTFRVLLYPAIVYGIGAFAHAMMQR